MFDGIYVADKTNNTIRKIDLAGNVTTFAGQVGVGGSDDGLGTNATFSAPHGLTVDLSNNVFVMDKQGYLIRKIDMEGNVTTVAGQGVSGSADALGTNASFDAWGITIDLSNNLFVADFANSTVRKVDVAGNVTTFAGQSGVEGSDDGEGTNATFNNVKDIVFNSSNNRLYVTDLYNGTIRSIDSLGNVTTVSGQVGVSGFADGVGTNATFTSPAGIAIDQSINTLYVNDQYKVRRITLNP